MFDFPKADAVSRGCGDREPGGVYAECGLSSQGRPLEEFLLDPPLPVPEGLDLVNKPQLWQRTLPTGEEALDAEALPIFDLLIWVGEEHYPYCPDFIEEILRYGASRRLNPNLDLSLLSRASRMILAHPRARNLLWHTQRAPETCAKDIPGHADASTSGQDADDAGERNIPATLLMQLHLDTVPAPVPQSGPCLFQLWQVIPQEAAQTVIDDPGSVKEEGDSSTDRSAPPLCLRAIGSTVYQYRPTGETAEGLVPGLFAVLPITGFAFIRFADGSVNERAREKVQAGLDAHGEQALPWYESDR